MPPAQLPPPQLIPAPLLSICVWSTLTALSWSLWVALQEGMRQLKRLHQIPCSQCRYFSGDYHLKCAVHPEAALTEAALECRDFQPTAYPVLPSPCGQPCYHKCGQVRL